MVLILTQHPFPSVVKKLTKIRTIHTSLIPSFYIKKVTYCVGIE